MRLLIQPFLWLLYWFLHSYARAANWAYFQQIERRNVARVRAVREPMIMAINHPNTFLDVTLTVTLPYRSFYFLANYGLFKNPILNIVLQTLYCIPIKRKQDVEIGENRDNSDAFDACEAHLATGRNLFIAPEGSSFQERHIREFRTGIARIALSTEQKNDWKLGLKVVPVGITYDNPGEMGGSAYVEIGEPVAVATWRDRYEIDPIKAADELAAWLERYFHQISLHCADRAEDLELQKIEAIFEAQHRTMGVDTGGWYNRSKILLEKLQNLKKDAPKYQKISQQVQTYFNILEENKLNAPKKSQFNGWTLALSLPFFIYGVLNNFLVGICAESVRKRLKLDESYDSTVKYAMGALIFAPIFYSIQTKIVGAWVASLGASSWWTWAYLVSLVPSAAFAHWVWREGKIYFNKKGYENLPAPAHTTLSAIESDIIQYFTV